MKLSPKVKKVWNIVTTVVVCIVVAVAACLFLPKLFGVKTYYVISGSMEPTIPTGSIIYVVDKDFSKVKKGDILTYRSGSAIVTHRAYRIFTDTDGKITSIQTKGDANSTPDGGGEEATSGNLTKTNLIGQTVLWIPLLGYVSWFVQTGPGIFAVVALGAVILIAIILPEVLFEKDKDDKNDD